MDNKENVYGMSKLIGPVHHALRLRKVGWPSPADEVNDLSI
jgi:hypothetical protein